MKTMFLEENMVLPVLRIRIQGGGVEEARLSHLYLHKASGQNLAVFRIYFVHLVKPKKNIKEARVSIC
jgi:hypothetical protein